MLHDRTWIVWRHLPAAATKEERKEEEWERRRQRWIMDSMSPGSCLGWTKWSGQFCFYQNSLHNIYRRVISLIRKERKRRWGYTPYWLIIPRYGNYCRLIGVLREIVNEKYILVSRPFLLILSLFVAIHVAHEVNSFQAFAASCHWPAG